MAKAAVKKSAPPPPPDPHAELVGKVNQIADQIAQLLRMQRMVLRLQGLTLDDVEQVLAAQDDAAKMQELVDALATSKIKHDALKNALDAQATPAESAQTPAA